MKIGGRTNCKPGDLAVVVRARHPANLGRILHIVSFAGEVDGWNGVDRWNFDGAAPLAGILGGESTTVRDCNIRPLRDTPGEDETLQWALVPGERITT